MSIKFVSCNDKVRSFRKIKALRRVMEITYRVAVFALAIVLCVYLVPGEAWAETLGASLQQKTVTEEVGSEEDVSSDEGAGSGEDIGSDETAAGAEGTDDDGSADNNEDTGNNDSASDSEETGDSGDTGANEETGSDENVGSNDDTESEEEDNANEDVGGNEDTGDDEAIGSGDEADSEGEPEATNPDDATEADDETYSRELFEALFTNISKSYYGTGEPWKAMDLAAIDEEDQVDYEKVIAEAIVAYNAPDEMNLQASILALDALGLFADNLSPEDAGGQGINASDTEDSDESETDVAEEETDTSESDAVNNDESEENEPEVDEGESYDESETESVNNDESEGDETEATDDEGAEEDADTEDDEESYAEDTDTDEDSGYGYNLVETLYNSEISASTLSGKAFKLLVSWYYGNPDEEDGSTEWRDLVDDIIALQNEDGGWSSSGIVSDVTATALVLTALAPCREHDFYDSDWEIYDEAEQAVQKGLEALKKMQLSNGGFASTNNPEEIDVNTTATVIIALAATGTDAETWKVEATPLAALLSQANEAKDGFLYDGKTDDIVTELGFRALVAYQGYLNAVWIAEQYNSTSDSSCYYNIYLSAWRGSAGLEPPEIWTVPPDASAAAPPPDASAAAAEAAKAKGSGNAASKPKDTSTSKEEDSGDKSSLPATGDSSALMLAVFSLIVLSALVCFARYRVLRRYH